MPLTIRRLDADDGLGPNDWLPLIASADCNNVAISNRESGDGLWLCTEPTDPKTRLYVTPGGEQSFAAPMHLAPHFMKDKPALWVKTVSGAGPVIVYWL